MDIDKSFARQQILLKIEDAFLQPTTNNIQDMITSILLYGPTMDIIDIHMIAADAADFIVEQNNMKE